MDLISLFLFTHENNEIKSPTKIYDFTVYQENVPFRQVILYLQKSSILAGYIVSREAFHFGR